MKKKVLAVILTVAILSSLVVTAAGAASVSDFADVSSDSWYYESVDFVSSKGYMIGVGTTPETFAPEYNMTRAMFVTVLARVAGVKVDNTKSSFDDVKVNEWYTGAVAWAVEAGVTTGVGGNNFAPDAFVTREDMATFMSRFVTWYSKTTGNSHRNKALVESFTDAASIRDYAKDAVEQCRQWGLINGYDNGAFGPQDFSTRAQVAAVISRLYWIVNAGGGPLGDTHKVTVSLSRNPTIYIGNSAITPEVVYTFSDGETIENIAKGLVTGENKDGIIGSIDNILKSQAFNSSTRPFKTQYNGSEVEVIVTVNEGTVSATLNAPMSVIMANEGVLSGNTGDITEVNADNVQELINRLQGTNGVASVTVADLAILNKLAETTVDADLLDKALESAPAEVKNLVTDDNKEDIINQANDYITDVVTPVREALVTNIVAENSGVKKDDLYSSDVENLSATVLESNISVDTKIAAEDVEDLQTAANNNSTMSVSINLADYLTRFENPNSQVKADYVDKVVKYLNSVKGTKTVSKTAVKEYVDAVCNVKSIVTANENGTITFTKDSTAYYNYIVSVKDAAIKLYNSLKGDETFYTNIITNAIEKAESMDATVTSDVSTIAKVLAAGKVSHDNAEKLGTSTVSIIPSAAYVDALAYIKTVQYVPATVANILNNYAPATFGELPQFVQNYLQGTFTATVTVE